MKRSLKIKSRLRSDIARVVDKLEKKKKECFLFFIEDRVKNLASKYNEIRDKRGIREP